MVTCFFTTSRPGGEVDLLRFMVRRPSQNDGACTHARTRLYKYAMCFQCAWAYTSRIVKARFNQQKTKKIEQRKEFSCIPENDQSTSTTLLVFAF